MEFLFLGIAVGGIIGFLGGKLLSKSKDEESTKMKAKLEILEEISNKESEKEERLSETITLKTKQNLTEMLSKLKQESSENYGKMYSLLENNSSVTKEILIDTKELQSAFSNNQKRGAFGEFILDSILSKMGFVKGVNYKTQFTNDAGKRPDFIFNLPNDQYLVIDTKFPFSSYKSVIESVEIDKKELKKFGSEIEKHYKSIVKREYIKDPKSITFACMLIPNDSIYSFINSNFPEIIEEAFENNVVICSPVLIYPILNLAKSSIEIFNICKKEDHIIKLLDSFDSEWEKYQSEFNSFESYVEKLYSSFEKLKTTRRKTIDKVLSKREDIKSKLDNAA